MKRKRTQAEVAYFAKVRNIIMRDWLFAYDTSTFRYYIDSRDHLCRVRLSALGTTEMLNPGSVEILD